MCPIEQTMSAQLDYSRAAMDYNRLAQAQAYTGTAQGIAPPSLMSDLVKRLQELSGLLNDADGDLVALHDRLFGAIPRGVAGGKGDPTKAVAGQHSEVIYGLDTLIDRARAVRDEASRLNANI